MMLRRISGFLVLLLAFSLLVAWRCITPRVAISPRLPIPANHPSAQTSGASEGNPGSLSVGTGEPGPETGVWPCFRGPARNGIVTSPRITAWPEKGLQPLWKIKAGEGHAGVAIDSGRVFLLDYDESRKEDAIRCLSFTTGEEIWRYSYSVKIKRNHGMSRTVPAVAGDYVVTLGPKCHLCCLQAASGELVFKKDLVKEYGTRIPEWYAGQCPLIDDGRLILAPGGSCLMTAIELATGNTLWQTPNPEGWQMSHSSILAIDFEGERMYIWCSSDGAVGIRAADGALLWSLPEWKIKIATIPTPIEIGPGKILFTGGYNAGAAAYQLEHHEGGIRPAEVFRCDAKTYGSDQQTPVFHNGLVFAVIPGGKPACLTPDGKRQWIEEDYNFGLGPYLLFDDKMLILDDDHNKPGELTLFQIEPAGLKRLAGAKVIEGHDAWAPMAYADGRIILRDATTLVCLDVSGSGTP
ncbi:PQQ-like beta-propeller repeat protein [bacterium]|nr:PQQ-like beta-propeller repeat protein [bacterium]